MEALTALNAAAGVQATPIGDLQFLALTGVGDKPGSAGSNATVGFAQMVEQGLHAVNGQLLAGQTDLQQLALGNAQNLHQIMIRLEESRLSFQLMMQVRSRLLEAYQDVMKMPI